MFLNVSYLKVIQLVQLGTRTIQSVVSVLECELPKVLS